jgi:hypothetical protein
MLIFWSCSQGVRAYQQVKDTCLVRPDSSVVRASGICLEGSGFNPQSGCLFCLTVLWYTSFKADSLSFFHYGSDELFSMTILLVHVQNTG